MATCIRSLYYCIQWNHNFAEVNKENHSDWIITSKTRIIDCSHSFWAIFIHNPQHNRFASFSRIRLGGLDLFRALRKCSASAKYIGIHLRTNCTHTHKHRKHSERLLSFSNEQPFSAAEGPAAVSCQFATRVPPVWDGIVVKLLVATKCRLKCSIQTDIYKSAYAYSTWKNTPLHMFSSAFVCCVMVGLVQLFSTDCFVCHYRENNPKTYAYDKKETTHERLAIPLPVIAEKTHANTHKLTLAYTNEL